MKKRVFIDMDGTLYRFHDHIVDESGHVQIEKMYEPDFFIKLDPFENMKDAINLLYSVDKEEVEIFVLSSADIKEVVEQKNYCLDRDFPFIDEEHRLFPKTWESKTEKIPEGIRVGDIHGEIDISKLNTQNFSQAKAGDYLIVCGDFGLIWDMKPSRAEEYWMKWLSEKPWITLFVDGNHENFDRLKNYPITEEWGGKVQKIYDKVYHLMRGEIYLIEGKKIFTFGGAFSHDKMYRREGISWWEDELPTKEECEYAIANLKTVGDTVDVIITHDAPKSIARRYGYDRVDMSQVYATDKEDITAFLEHISHFVNYKQWYCGHYHMDFDDSESFHFLYQTILKIDM